ncbi:MAG TPA: glycosyltransferase, partial [Gemmatimonadales bacterium]|nr:glycosyltransferase [Gemmatimonadales bacterium]
ALTDRGLSTVLDLEVFAGTESAAARDISHSTLPPRLRPTAFGVLDISEFFGETTGGVKTYLLQKSRYVETRPRLRQVLVVPGARDSILETSGVRCYRLHGPSIPTQKPYRFMLATRSTSRIVAHERPSLIEVGSAWCAPWLIHLATRRIEVPAVWFYHSNFPRVIAPWPATAGRLRRTASDFAWRYARRLSRLVEATLAPSDFVAGELEREGIERVQRVSLGVDLERFHPRRREYAQETRAHFGLPDGPLALFVGRFAREKELDLLLEAWPEVERRTGARLALIGDGPSRRRLQRRPHSERLFWLPFERDRTRLADLLAAVDLYVAPCSLETFGLSALEALASGTPLLTADRGGVAETVARSGGGAVFHSGDSGSLADTACRLFTEDLGRLGAVGRAYAEVHHGWDTVLDRLFATYRRILDPRCCSSQSTT